MLHSSQISEESGPSVLRVDQDVKDVQATVVGEVHGFVDISIGNGLYLLIPRLELPIQAITGQTFNCVIKVLNGDYTIELIKEVE
ncbi:MAG: hypothetical protein KBD00_02265 [Candidatus Peribacteraceae bacterium]|nr:hypothetical protein [Candidatus Peribacteraceae bacterium]